MNKLLGVFGGSFNPIHMGHLILAEYIREEFNLDKVIFIPTGNPPHKLNSELEGAQHRYNMVKLAIDTNPYFLVSNTEIERVGVSYTYDTLIELNKKYPKKNLFFICGSDSIIQFPTWRKIDKILKLANIIVADRHNISESELGNLVNEYKNEYKANICYSSAPKIEISSSHIRNRIQNGLSINYMVPEVVTEYIIANGLYQGDAHEYC